MLDYDELYASKLVAALDRQHPRDLSDVMLLFKSGGITPRMRRAFTVYLADTIGQSELLAPHHKDIRVEFKSDFAGMTNRDVVVEQLIEVREQLFRGLPASFDELERNFLLSVNRLRTCWRNPQITGCRKPAAIRWKLLNLKNCSNQIALNISQLQIL